MRHELYIQQKVFIGYGQLTTLILAIIAVPSSLEYLYARYDIRDIMYNTDKVVHASQSYTYERLLKAYFAMGERLGMEDSDFYEACRVLSRLLSSLYTYPKATLAGHCHEQTVKRSKYACPDFIDLSKNTPMAEFLERSFVL